MIYHTVVNDLIVWLLLGYLVRGQRGNGERLHYSQDFLMDCCVFDYGALDQIQNWPSEILRADLSCVSIRDCANSNWLAFHFLLAKAQSLHNKLYNLQANIQFLSDYWNACVISLTETWLKERNLDSDLEIEGFRVSSVCSPYTELLSLSLRSFYLPQEFPQIFISVV